MLKKGISANTKLPPDNLSNNIDQLSRILSGVKGGFKLVE